MFLTDLADVIRAAGLTVHEVPGWRTRSTHASGMTAVTSIFIHHTAGPKSGDYPSLATVKNGRQLEGIPGPLAQIGLGRSGDVWLVAAGRANHPGRGSGHGLPTNDAARYALGIEMESTGYGDWTAAQLRNGPILAGALSRAYRVENRRIIGHKEWTTRKIDPAGWPGDMAGFRATAANPRTTPAPTPEDDMTDEDRRVAHDRHAELIAALTSLKTAIAALPASTTTTLLDTSLDTATQKVGRVRNALSDTRTIARRTEVAVEAAAPIDYAALAAAIVAVLPTGAEVTADAVADILVARLAS